MQRREHLAGMFVVERLDVIRRQVFVGQVFFDPFEGALSQLFVAARLAAGRGAGLGRGARDDEGEEILDDPRQLVAGRERYLRKLRHQAAQVIGEQRILLRPDDEAVQAVDIAAQGDHDAARHDDRPAADRARPRRR